MDRNIPPNRRDLQYPGFIRRYPRTTLVNARGPSRRRKYVISDGRSELIVSVTDASSKSMEREQIVIAVLAKNGIPVPPVLDSFLDSERRYLVQPFVRGDDFGISLKSADKASSFQLGAQMGRLLARLHDIPVDDLVGVPASPGVWWDWFKDSPGTIEIPRQFRDRQLRLSFVHNDFLPHNLISPDSATDGDVILIDFEWSFVGDPVWDTGYLEWWINTEGFAFPDDVTSGLREGYGSALDQERGAFYAKIREPGSEHWLGAVPPPLAWLIE